MEHQVGDRSLASKVEYKIKRLSRADKANLAVDADAMRQIISDCE
jgi:predicted GIY-YIG superfamily endonuclease